MGMNKLFLWFVLFLIVGCTHKNNVPALDELFLFYVEDVNGNFKINVSPTNKLEYTKESEEQIKSYWSYIAKKTCKGSYDGSPRVIFNLVVSHGSKEGHRWAHAEMLMKHAIGEAKCR